MKRSQTKRLAILMLGHISLILASATFAGGDHDHVIKSPVAKDKVAAFDILEASAEVNNRYVTFTMKVNEEAGSKKPKKTGNFAGSSIWTYVWPTSLDPSVVGFEAKTGILALAATYHPDFDDTPLFDENTDGDTHNDGAVWHAHWVVLVPNDVCGKDALSVRDIPEGSNPRMPSTWSGVPMFLDSPGFTPVFKEGEIRINAVFAHAEIDIVKKAKFDAVTAALRVNENLHAPLACVTNVFDIASGDLSLPGTVK